MKILFNFFPILLFFITYKFFGIYNATGVAMIASSIQVVVFRIRHHRYEKMHLISLFLILLLGGATLFFHNPWFIKWKPTGIYWLTAVFFLGSGLFSQKPLIQKFMESNLTLSSGVWKRLNYAWVLFFIAMGAANLYVAYYFNTDTWVNFKLFGTTSATVVFVLLQALYLTHHTLDKPPSQNSSKNI